MIGSSATILKCGTVSGIVTVITVIFGWIAFPILLEHQIAEVGGIIIVQAWSVDFK